LLQQWFGVARWTATTQPLDSIYGYIYEGV
jgi:hypothetical protein